MISFVLIDRKGYRGTKIRRQSEKTDGPMTVRHVNPDTAGDVIPQGSKKDVLTIKDDTRGQPKHPWHQKAMDINKTDEFVKRLVPVGNEMGRCKRKCGGLSWWACNGLRVAMRRSITR